MSGSDLLYGWYDLQDLDQRGKIVAEYIWIDGSGVATRSKQRTLDKRPESVDELPEWNYDGSSTEQATTANSEIVIKPVAFYPDPFRKGDNILVLCEAFRLDKETDSLVPANTNFRHFAKQIFDKAPETEPWYGIEQEYTLFEPKRSYNQWPLGWPEGGFPAPQGPYYCSAGASVCYGRVIMDAHYRACLHAGLRIAGTNGEVMPGQWEYQIGPSPGIEIGDHMWMARYLLQRVTENFNVGMTIHPKPIKGDWNGTGCHTNYSTKAMREDGGFDVIKTAIGELEKKHDRHIDVYGEDNDQRLTGAHETESINTFSWGVGARGVSIRVPIATGRDGKGYLEDRRPSSNVDPYVHCPLIFDTTVLEGKEYEPLYQHFKAWRESR